MYSRLSLRREVGFVARRAFIGPCFPHRFSRASLSSTAFLPTYLPIYPHFLSLRITHATDYDSTHSTTY